MARISSLLLVAAIAVPALALLAKDAAVSLKERPIMKVVRLLQDMKTELEKELEDDKAVHEMLACWCKTNDQEKSQAIELGEQKAAELEASLSEDAAKVVELKTKRKSTQEEMYSDQAALGKAREMRMKDNKEFHAQEVDLVEAVKACQQAVTVLGQHHPALTQVRAMMGQLKNARVEQLVLASSRLNRENMLALKGFLEQGDSATSSFLSIPGMQSYAPQSGQVFGILKQMQADFEANLSEEQKTEAKAVEEFNALVAAKEQEIASAQKAIVQFDEDIAALGEKAAQEAQELEDTNAQLDMDRLFLADLKEKCAQSGAEFDTRVADRLKEIAAVDDTIKIINSDEAFQNFDSTVNTAFLQISTQEQEQTRRQRAASVLARAAELSGTPQLALIAASVQLDAFTKVRAVIDKMVTDLTQQQKDEVAQRDWCIDETDTNKRSMAAADDKKANLETKIADLEKSIETLGSDIKAAQANIAEAQKQMKRASETREGDNAGYQQTITEQRLTQMILNKALTRMKEVYAFLQKPGAAHIATSGTHTDAGNGPASFKKMEKNAGGSRVVAMIEEVIADSRKMEDEAIQSEEDAQSAYENFMKDSNKSITLLGKAIANMSESKAKAKVELSIAETDLKSTFREMEGLNAYSGDLRKSCDFLIKNFDARQAARTAEMDALREAKAILSGAK